MADEFDGIVAAPQLVTHRAETEAERRKAEAVFRAQHKAQEESHARALWEAWSQTALGQLVRGRENERFPAGAAYLAETAAGIADALVSEWRKRWSFCFDVEDARARLRRVEGELAASGWPEPRQ